MNARLRLPDGSVVSLTDEQQARLNAQIIHDGAVVHGMDLDYHAMMKAKAAVRSNGNDTSRGPHPKCGTRPGYRYHLLIEEKACPSCLHANRSYKNAYQHGLPLHAI